MKKKSRYYEVTATVGGRRRHFYGATKREAVGKRDAYMEMFDRCPLADKEYTLAEWCNAWLSSIRSDISPATYTSYFYLIRKHISRAQIGNIPLIHLTPSMFRVQWQRMIDGGLSPRTVSYVHTVVSEALKQAAADGAVPSNPLLNVRRPKQPRRSVSALTEEQVQTLLSSIDDAMFCRLVRLALASGMRRGEILGLAWSSVDFEKGTVSVNQSVIRANGKEVISTDLKNQSSRRTLSLDEETMEALRAQRVYDMELRLRSSGFHDMDLVFCREDGSPLRQNSVSLKISRIFRGLGWSGFTFHTLRHTHATLLIKHGVNFKIVQYRLGHATFQQTMDTYSHVTPDMEHSVLGVLREII